MLTEEQAAVAKGLLSRGEKQQDIAAFFGENIGRINELKHGHRYPEVAPAPNKDLPSRHVVTMGWAVHLALKALTIAEIGIQSAREAILAAQPVEDVDRKGKKRKPH